MASKVIFINIDFQNFPHKFVNGEVINFKNLICQEFFVPMDGLAWIIFKDIDTRSYRYPC
jgi:hypothetical protein